MSLVAGIDQSRGDAVIMMDCDLQHPPAVIRQLLEKFEDGYDVVHAIREYDGQPPRQALELPPVLPAQNTLSPVEMRRGPPTSG